MTRTNVHLTIDTSAVDTAKASLEIGDIRIDRETTHVIQRAQAILPLIESCCSDAGIGIRDITSVTVITGPGSYTGLRIGAAVANMLGALLGIPVNGGTAIVAPKYS